MKAIKQCFQCSLLSIFLTLKRFVSFSVECLRCYTCNSKVNWTQCDQQRKRVICQPWLDVCAKIRVSYNNWGRPVEVYQRGCFADNLCTPKACMYIARRTGGNATGCDINCCDLELCNGSPVSRESNLLVGIPVAFIVVKRILRLLF